MQLSIAYHAEKKPNKPAIILARTGETVTYQKLNERSNQIAQMLYAAGLRPDDRIAIFMENHVRYMEIAWAAFRSGLYLVTLNKYSTVDDVEYIMKDSGAKAIFSSTALAAVAKELPSRLPADVHFLMVGGTEPGWSSYEEVMKAYPATPLDEEWIGDVFGYTSGTTGRPKGVLRHRPQMRGDEVWPDWKKTGEGYGFHQDMVNLCPAPLYHGAPIRSVRPTHMAGGTVILMEKFDALETLRLIEKYRVTHAQWVPTMFIRLLKLPVEQREAFDLSSLECAIHAAAPCPVNVKKKMIDWWGPIIHEYYGGTDSIDRTGITCEEWLAHPGSVGKAPPSLRICDEEGNVLPAGKSGLVYFIGTPPLPEYLNDPEKTRAARHSVHDNWMSVGDMGYLDEEGYLFLTDRKAFTIISGGVNIYPQAIEDALLEHAHVADAAVFGVPNEDLGEEVKAVVQLVPGVHASVDTQQELQKFLQDKIAKYMLPRSIDFTEKLPRSDIGKLLKKELRDTYWKKTEQA